MIKKIEVIVHWLSGEREVVYEQVIEGEHDFSSYNVMARHVQESFALSRFVERVDLVRSIIKEKS